MINTPEDWWRVLDEHWSNLLECFARAGAPLGDKAWSDDGLGAPVDHPKSMSATLEDAKVQRDHKTMLHMLNLCWIVAPDKPYIHEWPSWHDLCDLCSEGWVFEET